MAKRITSHDQNGDDILNLFKKDQDGATSIDVNHRVRVGIIGTGWIAAAHIKSYLKMPDVDIVAGADLIPGKAETFFKNQGVENVHCYENHREMLEKEQLDAVSICTYNRTHAECAIDALNAGVHVLLEKPFTATAAEARELFALADAKGLVLMEAITIPYLPQYAFLQAELPKIGEVRGAMASFCARSARYDDYLKGIWNTTFDPACLGGALNDMNVYNLHLLCGLLGVPGRAEYRPSCGPNGIDTAGLALLDYGGFTAAALAAKDSEGRNGMVLQGPGGYLVVEGGTNALPVVYSVLGGVRGGGTRVDGPKPERHRMAYEFAEFARIIAEKDADAETAARMRTMRVMELLDVLHEK